MLIIPRTASPPPPPRPIPLEERPVEMLSMEELQQLVRRQRVSLFSEMVWLSIRNNRAGGESHR